MIVEANQEKFKVYWQHQNQGGIPDRNINGCTYCTVIKWGEEDEAVAYGRSICSIKDNFNKSKGRIVSLTKAIKHLPKDVRAKFFEQYKKEIGFK